MSKQSLVAMQLRLGVHHGQLPREVMPKDGEIKAAARDRDSQHKARLSGLWLQWQHTRNPYFAWEAVCIAIEIAVAPPAWALLAIAPGMRRHLSNPGGDPAVQMGLKRRGGSRTQPHALYRQRYALDAAMRMIWKRKPGESIVSAARRARTKHKLTQSTETLTRYFSRDWSPLYRELYSTD